jgi:hypothetical protein
LRSCPFSLFGFAMALSSTFKPNFGAVHVCTAQTSKLEVQNARPAAANRPGWETYLVAEISVN